MSEFLISLKSALPTLVIIFFTVFVLILITRLVFAFFLFQARKRYEALKRIGKKALPIFPNKKHFIKEEDELSLKKPEFPRAHSAVKAEMWAKQARGEDGSYEIIKSEEQELDQAELNNTEIVDIVKPVGFWTSMILGQKLTYLIQSANIINKKNNKGFWVSMIEAQEQAAGRQHGRGR